MEDLPLLASLKEPLYMLMTTGNEAPHDVEKYEQIEAIAGEVIICLEDQALTKASCGDLERHAYSVNDGIRDGDIRNRHILFAV